MPASQLGIDAGMLSDWVEAEWCRIAAAKAHEVKLLEAAERAEPARLRRQVAETGEDNAYVNGVPQRN